MRVNDAITGLLILGLGVFVYFHSGTFSTMPGIPYGPDVFPRVIACLLALGGILLILSGVKSSRRDGWFQLDAWARQGRSYLLFFAIAGSLVFYVLFSEALGFLLISFFILLCLLLITRGPRRLVSSTVVALAFTFIAFFLFGQILRVPLPHGFAETFLLG